uniref:Uncharacterized protein n=2 Tax=Lotharella globosa TaxID=91324 RepID=A0A7S3Y8T8_9EUKA
MPSVPSAVPTAREARKVNMKSFALYTSLVVNLVLLSFIMAPSGDTHPHRNQHNVLANTSALQVSVVPSSESHERGNTRSSSTHKHLMRNTFIVYNIDIHAQKHNQALLLENQQLRRKYETLAASMHVPSTTFSSAASVAGHRIMHEPGHDEIEDYEDSEDDEDEEDDEHDNIEIGPEHDEDIDSLEMLIHG